MDETCTETGTAAVAAPGPGAPPPSGPAAGVLTVCAANQSGRLYSVSTGRSLTPLWEAGWGANWTDVATYVYGGASTSVIVFRGGEMAGLALGSTAPIRWRVPLPYYDGVNGVRFVVQNPDLSVKLYAIDRPGTAGIYNLTSSGAQLEWNGQWTDPHAWERGGVFYLNGSPYLFLQSNSPPGAGIDTLGPSSQYLWRSNVLNWAKPWDFVAPVVLDRNNPQPYVFMYSWKRGEAAIEMIVSPMQGTSPTWTGSFRTWFDNRRSTIGYALPQENQAPFATLLGLGGDGVLATIVNTFNGPSAGPTPQPWNALRPPQPPVPDKIHFFVNPGPLPS